MMGHRGVLKCGYEYDFLTSWRHTRCRHAGDARLAKQAFNRRERRAARVRTVIEAHDL